MTGLAGDGRCKTFDASADGFGRSEGSGAVPRRGRGHSPAEGGSNLQGRDCPDPDTWKLRESGEAVEMTVVPPPSPRLRDLPSSARCRTLCETRSCSLDAAVRDARRGGVGGTALGDPIEVGAQEKIYGKDDRADQDQLILAASKSVIAHLEGAAGVAGITKLVKMLEHKWGPQPQRSS
eukprot:Skav203416  [mRNA]  locus=scaffold1743:317112:320929:- [translate_table: standard]